VSARRYADPCMAEPFTVLIMAAGRGTRMRSSLPKVLHPVCGRPMVEWVIEAAQAAGAGDVVCITRPGDGVAEGLPEGVAVAEQRQGEGTGSAVLAARERISPERTVVVLSGDHPLVSRALVEELLAAHGRERATATILTTEDLDPAGYGRIVRGPDGSFERIVETKHTDGVPPNVLALREVNMGTYAFHGGELVSALEAVEPDGGEVYLTGVFPVLVERGLPVVAHPTGHTVGAFGINSRVDLMEAEQLAQRQLIERHAEAGVTFASPSTTSLDAAVEIGEDTTIGPGVTLKGPTRIGRGCEVGPQTTMVGATVGDGVSVPHSYLVECEVRDGATIGPFAHLRPGTVIGEGAKVGTFVEVKNSNVGRGAKVPHLSYIGDTDIGEDSNIGAGTITANYDGRRKHRTKIGNKVKTGIHTSLVAPVDVGDRAYTGAGSVIDEDVPEGALGISRPEQKNVEGYADRVEDKEPRE
jgi:bifunctional UDP-N-acetylglucosamine pyrophosphorylase / glucosamine-1-phosphate N-acetyltransferase